MVSKECANCTTRFDAKSEAARTCSARCRKALSRSGGVVRPQKSPHDRTAELLEALIGAPPEVVQKFAAQIAPVELADVAMSPLRLRNKYGATANIGPVLKARGLPANAALIEFLEES
jgi:hypothetical protein